MKHKERKKLQRIVNKKVRTFNKQIKNNDFWKGRFELRQIFIKPNKYTDGTEELYLQLGFRLIDKKYKDYCDFYNNLDGYDDFSVKMFCATMSRTVNDIVNFKFYETTDEELANYSKIKGNYFLNKKFREDLSKYYIT